MKKIKFLNGIGSMCAFAVVALVGSLFASCEKEDLDATFESEAAKAIITCAVYDADGKDVTSAATFTTTAGTVAGNTVTIAGNKDIAKQSVTIKATYQGEELAPAIVEIPALKAGTVSHYSASFSLKQLPPVEVKKPAEATIIASAFDGEGQQVEATFSFKRGDEVSNENPFTFKATEEKMNLDETVVVEATYNEKTLSKAVAVKLNENQVGSYSVEFTFNESQEVVLTSYIVTAGNSVKTEDGKYFLTGTYNHTHNGIDNWLTNDTEYIIDYRADYKYYVGYAVANVKWADVVDEEAKEYADDVIDHLNVGIRTVDTFTSFKVSAWSIFAAWTTVTKSVTPYTVTKVVTTVKNGEKSEESAEVVTFDVVSKTTEFAHEEAAHPSHSHAYVPGHGHDHGHGNGNAGGGIVMPD